MSGHEVQQTGSTPTGGSGSGIEGNSRSGTFAPGSTAAAGQTPIGENEGDGRIENHILVDVERFVQAFRNQEQSKGATYVSIARAIESSLNPPDTRRNAIVNYTTLLDNIEHERRLQAARGQNAGGGDQPPGQGSPNPPPQQRPGSRAGSNALARPGLVNDAIDDLFNSIHPGSNHSSDSESDREDGGKRKQRDGVVEHRMPWYDDERHVRNTGNPSINLTRKTLEYFAKDLAKVKRFIGAAQTAPQEFPSSEWDNIIRGHAVNLDVVLSSLHHVSAPRENRGRIGDNEISLGRSEPTRKVETSGQWISAWNATVKAVRFTFKHREDELRTYGEFIEGLFSSRLLSSHPRVILFDKAVRAQVAGGQRVLLTNSDKFSRLASAILMPDGIESDRSSKQGFNTGSSKSGSTCNRFNSFQGCSNTKGECKYRHVCKKCNTKGHGAYVCTAPSSSSGS